MKKILLCFYFFVQSSCFASVIPSEFQQFIKEYSNSNEKFLNWPETVYAIEKDFSDEIVIFCINKIGLGSLTYSSRQEEWQNDKSDIEYKKIFW